ncbi:hypothetical protein Taro_026018 [Colocasia esculenta]|uniref:Uncharacterized protein n=1 Tax=Colocasia esculenta TaxID=4460 RepID=A0A843VBS3_COLES|nr:hypothetical protein [Colocasia esculenta]
MVVVFAHAAVGFVLGLHVRVGVSRRLREPVCGVAFTSAGLFPVDLGVSLLDVCLALCACVPLGTVLFSLGIFARAKQMLVCHVAPLIECCDTCLWLLPALCWLFVNSGEVFPKFFSVGSSGGEVFPRTVLWSFLVVAALPSVLSLFGRCRSRYCALGRVSGRGAGQVVLLFVFKFSRLCWWDFVCPQGREVCFISRALCALPDGSLVSAVGVWLFVLIWMCRSCLAVFPCVWKRLVVRVSFPYFPLVARGDDAPLECCVARVCIVATFGWSHLPLSCFWVELVAPLVLVFPGWLCCTSTLQCCATFGLDCCVQSACLPLVKVVDLDRVCSPVFWPVHCVVGFPSWLCRRDHLWVPVV